MVSKLASEHVTVVPPEMAAMSCLRVDRYIKERTERQYAYIPSPIRQVAGFAGSIMPEGAKGRNFLRHLALDGADRYLDANVLFREYQKTLLFEPDAYKEISQENPRTMWHGFLNNGKMHWLSALQYMDIKLLANDILTKSIA
jgi:hypothetical protein